MKDYVMNNEGEYGKYIVQSLKAPAMSAEFNAFYKTYAERLLWIDSNVAPGSFQMNTSWYLHASDVRPLSGHDEHVHRFDEMIGFIGSNHNDPYDLGGVVDIGINGEIHRLTKTSIIFMPAGLKHLPLSIIELNRPILHFSISINPFYGNTQTAGEDAGKSSVLNTSQK